MSRTIILVDLYWTRDKDPRIPLGHGSLLASLRENEDLDVRSVVVPVNAEHHTAATTAEAILGHARGVPSGQVDIAIGAYAWGEGLIRDLLSALRARGFEGRIILGGPQISYCSSGLKAHYPEADGFIRGYAEQALACVARGADRTPIPGVLSGGEIDGGRQAVVSLEALPSPWLSGTIPLDGQPFIRWETQRGCPFRCSFCQHREPGARLRRRALGLPRIEAEIDLFCEHGVEDIAVLDPIFNAVPHAVGVLQRFADNGFSGRLSLQCRAEMIDAAFLDIAQAVGARLEFGLQTIHPHEGAAVQRRNHIDKVDRALAEVRRRAIAHEVSLIFGLPMQTLESFEESVRWCLERQVPVIKAFPLLLLRGTALDIERDRWGFRDRGGSMPMVIESSSFGYPDWLAMARLSEALALTEGRHPTSLEELRRLAADLEPSIHRWQPSGDERAA